MAVEGDDADLHEARGGADGGRRSGAGGFRGCGGLRLLGGEGGLEHEERRENYGRLARKHEDSLGVAEDLDILVDGDDGHKCDGGKRRSVSREQRHAPRETQSGQKLVADEGQVFAVGGPGGHVDGALAAEEFSEDSDFAIREGH